MKTRFQTYLLLLTVLLLGFIAGFLVNGQFVRHKVKRLRGFVNQEEQFIEQITGSLDLTEEEREAIQPLLQEHFSRIHKLQKTHRKEIRKEFDQLRQGLSEHLSEDQIRRLHRNMRHFNRRPGPPHHHRPPHR